MSKQPNYHYQSITEVSELLRQGKLSPVDLVTESLQRIGQLNDSLNAFITVLADQAMAEAKTAEREIKAGGWKGPLHGIPVGIKDMYDTAGIRTTAAFAVFKDRIPARDAIAVTRLREAGAILIGKTNMHMLAMGTTSVVSYFGAVHNPWNPEYIAGGSSGGSAAAIAAGLCYATLDTDAIGSCRLPAACCGITGFKATYGLIDNRGILEGEAADENILKIAHAAFMCRSAEDAVILLDVLANRQGTGMNSVKKPGIGIARGFKATNEIQTIFREAIESFRSLGYDAKEMDRPLEFPAFDFRNIEEDRKTISASLFGDIDVLLIPTTADLTPTIEAAGAGGPQALSAENTFFCNYYGLPAVSIPCGFSKNGMPVGLQIVGPKQGEDVVLATAQKFQQGTQWHKKYPSIDIPQHARL